MSSGLLIRLVGGVLALAAAYTLLACMAVVPQAPWTAGLDTGGQWLVGLISAGLGIGASWIAVGGATPGEPSALGAGGGEGSESPHVVRSDENGVIVLERRGIEAVARGAGERTPGVVSVSVRLTPIGASTFWVFADATLAPQHPIKQTSQQLREELRGALEELAGVEVQQISIVARVSPEGLGSARTLVAPAPPSRR